ncbi:protein lava lamp-like isoform X2 [Thrips palmi]|uniref:Protein lava lamp-like isoform X2 n=1 Tax=Thrips palmi TaxID=161013 RepID=A0A6P8ZDA0_THRPL|nr:protein lava lamp-like isoform X2 [Thrips palmi]
MEDQESFPPDTEDVREQIEQQRTLAAQLKEKLEQDELQLASKEQKNELLKSKLSLLKSRTKAKRASGANDKDDNKAKGGKDQSSASPKNTARKQTPTSANKGKINILREQLEQNRLKFERHGQELSEDTRSMEVMVEQLRHELEERDVTIQQLQDGQVPIVSSVCEEPVSEPVDVSTLLLQKENDVKNLSSQVIDLQNVILELQENLKEKDCVIEARTQAISLLSEDMSKKWRANVDMLEETRLQMQMMQENFVRIEAGLNAEIDQLNVQLQNNASRLAQAEQNVKAAESSRDDFASQNAELLAELNRLKEAPKEASGLEDAKSKIDELSQALSEANKLTVKLKADHKAKVKTLNKQIDSLRKESDLSGEVVQLQNHIAELEEEKGNLQLHIIEIEESTGTQEQKINELEKTIQELQNQKVVSEMKLIEVEDQLSSYAAVMEEANELKLKLVDREDEIQHLKDCLERVGSFPKADLHSDLQDELKDARSAVQEWEVRYVALEKQFKEKNDELVSALSDLSSQRSLQSIGQDSVSDAKSSDEEISRGERILMTKVQHLEQSIRDKQIEVQELEALVRANLERIDNLISTPAVNPDSEELKERIRVLESQIMSFEASVNMLQEENGTLKESLSLLKTSATAGEQVDGNKTSMDQNSSIDTSQLQRELIEASGELELKRDECTRLESKLKAQVEKYKKIVVNLKVKTLANKELEERVNRYETAIQTHQMEVDQLSREKQDMLEKWQTEMAEKDEVLSQAADKLAGREMDVLNLSQQLGEKSAVIVDLEAKVAGLQAHVEELQLLIEEKSASLEKLNTAHAEQSQQAESHMVSALQGELISIKNQLDLEMEEKIAAITKLETFTKQAKIKLAKEKKVRTDLIEKQTELEALLAEKNAAITDMHEQRAQEVGFYQQEKERLEIMLKEHQELAANLQQQLEQERNKLQYANESLAIAEECVEVAQDLDPLPSPESFQVEVENLLVSLNTNSPNDVLPVLEQEKVKTMDVFSSSFASLHNQIIERLKNKPDVNGERKMFAELSNLVTRVINRTAALENKIKSIVAESDAVIHRKLFDAEQSIQVLESTLTETKQHLDSKEAEKINLEDAVNNLNRERWDLTQQIQQESEKYYSLERQLKETKDQLDSLIESTNSLQLQLSEKDNIIKDLQIRCEESDTHYNHIQNELHNANQQQSDLKLNWEKLNEECEMWKSKLLTVEQEMEASHSKMLELQSYCDNATERSEMLQQKLDEATQHTTELQLQLHKSEEEMKELNEQLSHASQSNSHLQHELMLKSDDLSQQNSSWINEKDQYEQKLFSLSQQLQEAKQQIQKDESYSQLATPHLNTDEVESLRKQLAQKSSEIETYQQRLMQLQMGAPESSASFFNHPNEKQEVSDAFHMHEKMTHQEAVSSSQIDTASSVSILDAFKPASSLFEIPSEVNDLQTKINNLTEQLDSLLSVKTSLEAEKYSLVANLDVLTEQLNATKIELESSHSMLNNLQLKVSELTAALQKSEECNEQEKLASVKLQNELRELQLRFESEEYDKQRAEGELKDRAQKDADARPRIPKTLDTHVSSLQDSGTGFNSGEIQNDSLDEEKADESLMESNITQMESELSGMVTSQRPSAEDSASEKPASLAIEVQDLQQQLAKLLSEKNSALLQIETLQAEIKLLSQSASSALSPTSPPLISDTDALMNEDDSWGWGVESAHLEAEHHQQKIQNVPPADDSISVLQGKIELLQVENAELEKDKTQLAEDLKASQIRAAKLTRKLKDLKSKYDDIAGKTRSTDSPFDSLDQAIEEERMKQMQNLEKELKDVQAEFSVVKTERDRLLKQVDVFSSANDRMLEAKERQDVEVEMWQKRSKDLTNQVQALEWKIRELEEGREEKEVSASESVNTVETPKLPPSTEILNPVEIEQLLKENHTWNANYESLMQEYQKLRSQCLADSEQRTQVDALLAQQKGMIERLEHEKTYFQDVYDSLKMDYESACAELASTASIQDDTADVVKKVEELEGKLSISEKQLEETITQLQAVSADNSDFQTQCSQLNESRRELLLQLEQSQSQLEAKSQEIVKLQEQVRVLEEKSVTPTADGASLFPTPVQETFFAHEHSVQGSSPNSSVLNWGSIVPSGEQAAVDIFESIASNTAQGMEEQLQMKENEIQKEKRMIETLRRSMEESEQEWGQMIEYHKTQLEAAKKTISDLQTELQTMHLHAANNDESLELKLNFNSQIEKCQELQNVVFAKDKEIESLQINLAVSEESKKRLESELLSKQAELERRLQEVPQSTHENPSQSAASAQLSIPDIRENTPALVPTGIPVMSSSDKNLSSELDLALYQLHERDVRCEELTLELTQLLEERDGLQLRLSNAIRTNEELRERLRQLLSSQPDDRNISFTTNLQGAELNASVSLENLNVPNAAYVQNVNPEGHQANLQNKLTELRTIGYSHDKRLKEDSEYRHQQQMRFLSPSPPTVLTGAGSEPTASEFTLVPASEPVDSSTNIDVNNAEPPTCIVS